MIETDGALILGAGIAGLFTALKLAPFPALVLAGSRPGASGSSAWAQGGIAAAVGEGDDWRDHAADTMAAGAGLCDPDIVDLVAREAPDRIADLVGYGAPFDRNADGALALGREAAHSPRPHRACRRRPRRRGNFPHPGGSARWRRLRSRCWKAFTPSNWRWKMAASPACSPATAPARDARLVLFRARAVIFATGGLGALYAVTTNPLEARGEGLGMAARAGALIADPEFVQFHPTAIAIGRDPAPLATEALRGEGAMLINEQGERFMTAVHRDAELAPRDVVARAIHRQIAAGQQASSWIAAKPSARNSPRHFPTVYAACIAAGIDPARAAHPGGAGRALSHGRHRLGRAGPLVAARPVGGGRMRRHRPARRQPAGLQFAAGRAGVRRPRGGGRARSTVATARRAALPPRARALRPARAAACAARRDERAMSAWNAMRKGLRKALAVIARLERTSGGEPALLNMLAAAQAGDGGGAGAQGIPRRPLAQRFSAHAAKRAHAAS